MYSNAKFLGPSQYSGKKNIIIKKSVDLQMTLNATSKSGSTTYPVVKIFALSEYFYRNCISTTKQKFTLK